MARGNDFADTVCKIFNHLFIQQYRRQRFNHLSPASRFALPWSAYVRLLSVKRPKARSFYEAEALRSGWAVRQLDRQIGSQFYERIALSRNKAAMMEKAETAEPGDTITPEEAIKDRFVLEFLDLKDEYSESELEEALIQHLTDFFAGIGRRFCVRGPPASAPHRRFLVPH
jgi:predicted nuclease of restriction endonuclease-like (RecB) superfamily